MLTMLLKGVFKRQAAPADDDSYSYSHYSDTDEVSDEFDFSVLASLGILITWLLLGAVVFDFIEEDWDYIDAVYFCFITGSTLGFGDFVRSFKQLINTIYTHVDTFR
jgi:hypothetical protein